MTSGQVWLIIWAVAAVFLVGLLFEIVGATGADVAAAIAGAPLWMIFALSALTGLNKLVGAAKWAAAARWLTPEAAPTGFIRRVELTAVGSFFGQILPIQLASAAVRWVEARRRGDGGAAVTSTLYEQVFDLIALIAFGVGGAAVLWLSPPLEVACFLMLAAAVCGLLGLRFGCRMAAAICGRFEGERFAAAHTAFARAAETPFAVVATLFAWSTARVAVTAARFLVSVVVFAPAATLFLAAAGYPLLGLATAAPVFPAGLGAAEWTISGVLIVAGAAPAAAAICALAGRVVNLASLLVVLALLAILRVLRVL